MRRWLPLCVVDAGLVALAYYLAFLLRFSNLSAHDNYDRLLTRTWPWVAVGTGLVLALSGAYRRRPGYGSQRNNAHVTLALVVATVLLVGIVALVHPAVRSLVVGNGGARVEASITLGLPAAVVASYFLLALAFLIGVRWLGRAIADRLRTVLRVPRDQRNGPVLP